MTRAYAKLALILFVSAYLLNLPLLNGQEDPSQADLVVLANTISDVQSLIENTRQQRSSVEINLETNEKAINDLNLSISDIQERINNEQTRLANLEQQSVELNILNAANEIAVAAFLQREISFTQIPVIIEEALNVQERKLIGSIEEVLEEDNKARSIASNLIAG